MSNKQSNYPSNQLNNLPIGTCSETISCLKELADKGKPSSIEELKQRIDDYFQFCADRDMRIGVESLALSLGVSRVTFWNWCNNNGCTDEWAEICQKAKQFVLTFLEQMSLSGKLNPATSIFLMKNWAGYKDTISFDENAPKETIQRTRTPEQIALEYGLKTSALQDNVLDLPDLPDV